MTDLRPPNGRVRYDDIFWRGKDRAASERNLRGLMMQQRVFCDNLFTYIYIV